MRLAQNIWRNLPVASTARATLVMRAAGVQRSGDLARIIELPRRAPNVEHAPDLTDAFRREGGELRLRPIQSAALLEAEAASGLVGSIGVGWGKTLIMLLLAEAMGAERAVLLVPAELKRQLLERDIPYYSRHFDLPVQRIAGVLSYTELERSATGHGALPSWWKWTAHLAGAVASPLDVLRPDLVVADEAHRLGRKGSARTGRFLRYAKRNPGCRFAFLSGSLASRSLLELGHLSRLALRKGSPLPLDGRALAEWAAALDPHDEDEGPALAPGALVLLCRDDQEPVREAFRRRCVDTPGWVATSGQSFAGSLYLRIVREEPPPVVTRALVDLRRTWAVGDQELETAVEFNRVARQLACGFYYRWAWPGGAPDVEWLRARKEWNREVRAFLQRRARQGMDSPKLLEAAAQDGRWDSEAWPAWAAVRHRPEPPREAVWISDYLVELAARWGRRAKEGIVWCQHVALADEIGRATGWPIFGEGTDAGTTDPSRTPLIVCSIRAQSEGKNLQAWSRSLVPCPPAGAGSWEQLLGRTHRPGQKADEVWCDVLVKATEDEDALAHAEAQARFGQETKGQEQKLLLAMRVEE